MRQKGLAIEHDAPCFNLVSYESPRALLPAYVFPRRTIFIAWKYLPRNIARSLSAAILFAFSEAKSTETRDAAFDFSLITLKSWRDNRRKVSNTTLFDPQSTGVNFATYFLQWVKPDDHLLRRLFVTGMISSSELPVTPNNISRLITVHWNISKVSRSMRRQYGHDTFGIIVEGISTTTRQISLPGLKEDHD